MVLLGAGVLCASISRVLLFIAACRISFAWAIGVLLPFGPMFFRLSYPDEARTSAIFRLVTLPCIGGYLLMGGISHSTLSAAHKDRFSVTKLVHYGTEKPPATPVPAPTISIAERRIANQQELARLQKWNEELRLRKRDLLHSDVRGNREYVVDLALYNEALAKATIERNALLGQQ